MLGAYIGTYFNCYILMVSTGNGHSSILQNIFVVLKYQNSSSDALTNQFFMCSSSVYGFPLLVFILMRFFIALSMDICARAALCQPLL